VDSYACTRGALIGQGRTAEIYTWGNRQILKLFIPGFPVDLICRERQTNRLVYEAGLPAPAVGEIVELEGRMGIVCERVDGPSMLHALVEKPWLLARMARQLAELQVAIHSRTGTDLPSQQERLKSEIGRAPRLSAGTKKRVLQVLEHLPDGNKICHGDFHPDNVLMAARGPVVIDWLDAGRGNPLADVARSALLLGVGSLPPGTGLFRGWLIQSFRRIFRALYLRRYFQLWPFAQAQMKAWLLPVAAARLVEHLPGEEDQLVRLVEAALKQ
jgi:uncharacterized protein (TIGR02172 family)